VREADIEKYARERIAAAGGWMLKWTSPGQRGVPDDIVFWPGGQVDFIEFKAPTGRLAPLQQHVSDRLLAYRQSVWRLLNKFGVDSYVAART